MAGPGQPEWIDALARARAHAPFLALGLDRQPEPDQQRLECRGVGTKIVIAIERPKAIRTEPVTVLRAGTNQERPSDPEPLRKLRHGQHLFFLKQAQSDNAQRVRLQLDMLVLGSSRARLNDADAHAEVAEMVVEGLPGFAAGEVSVQDLSAQLAAPLLMLAPGQRVLDACAAPGGKTGHILETLGGRGEVWAVDRDAERNARVRENLDRLGLAAKLVTGDAAAPENKTDDA